MMAEDPTRATSSGGCPCARAGRMNQASTAKAPPKSHDGPQAAPPGHGDDHHGVQHGKQAHGHGADKVHEDVLGAGILGTCDARKFGKVEVADLVAGLHAAGLRQCRG